MPPTIILQDKPSWIPIVFEWSAMGIIFGITFTVLASTVKGIQMFTDMFTIFAMLSIAGAVIRITIDLIQRAYTSYTLTDTQLIREKGIITRRRATVSLDKVQGIHIKHALIGRIFDYATIVISTAGPSIYLYSVPHAEQWEKKIESATI